MIQKTLTFKKKTTNEEYTVCSGLTYLGDISKKIDNPTKYLFFPYEFGAARDICFWSDCLRQLADKLDKLNNENTRVKK